MNYLAHLYFSNGSQNSLYGNLLGDFVKGKASQYTDKEILEGIALHRAIDKFTDSHPVVRESKNRLSDKRKRFSGIMIDVFYDHFLAVNWESYSSSSFEKQTNDWYEKLNAKTDIELPERMKNTIHMMRKNDLFSMYKSFDGISMAINGISRRIRFDNELAGGGKELEKNYSSLENDFHQFFSQLKQYVETIQH